MLTSIWLVMLMCPVAQRVLGPAIMWLARKKSEEMSQWPPLLQAVALISVIVNLMGRAAL